VAAFVPDLRKGFLTLDPAPHGAIRRRAVPRWKGPTSGTLRYAVLSLHLEGKPASSSSLDLTTRACSVSTATFQSFCQGRPTRCRNKIHRGAKFASSVAQAYELYCDGEFLRYQRSVIPHPKWRIGKILCEIIMTVITMCAIS